MQTKYKLIKPKIYQHINFIKRKSSRSTMLTSTDKKSLLKLVKLIIFFFKEILLITVSLPSRKVRRWPTVLSKVRWPEPRRQRTATLWGGSWLPWNSSSCSWSKSWRGPRGKSKSWMMLVHKLICLYQLDVIAVY